MNEAKRVQINAGRFFGTVILLGLLLAMAAFILSDFIPIGVGLADLRQTAPTQYAIIQVAEGDSVWSLAKNFSDSGLDLRKSVDIICEVNSLDGYVIHPGEELLIPMQ